MWPSRVYGSAVAPGAMSRDVVQIALGSLWLLDGLLQFQGYMYDRAFVSQVLEPSASGQPSLIGGPTLALAHLFARDQTLWNTLAGVTQCAIGLGVLIGGRALRPALLASFMWGFSVWWFGEGFGMLLTGAPGSPLMGAPGAAVLYVLLGLLVWPRRCEHERSVADAGILGDLGGRIVWSGLWLEAAVLWLLDVNRSANSIHDQLLGMAGSAPHALAGWQRAVADATQAHGELVACALVVLSLAIGAGVWRRGLRRAALAAGVMLALAYWVLGQSLGGPFWDGAATDVNTGPLLVLLALTLAPHRSGALVFARRRAALAPRTPGRSRSRVAVAASVPVALFGVLLLSAPSLFTSSGAASPAPGAMGMMGMSADAGSRPERSAGPCSAAVCPILRPGPNQLAVAGELGSALAALWVVPTAGGFDARLELLKANMRPIADPVAIAGSSSRRACGPGCWTFALRDPRGAVSISTLQAGHRYTLRLPIRWEPGKSSLARRLLAGAVKNMQGLPGVRVDQTLTSGPPGEIEKIDYRLSAPHRMAYSVSSGARVVVIDGTEWSSEPGHGWQRSNYGGGGAFDTRSWYDWEQYDSSIQLLDEHDVDGRVIADLSLMSPALPVWFQLTVDVSRRRVGHVRMVAGGHFMSESYSEFGFQQRVVSPRR
jgi:hypothetical protein